MCMKAINEYTVNWKLYRSWCLEYMFYKFQLLLRMIWFVFMSAFIFLIIISDNWIFGIMVLYCIYTGFIRNIMRGKKQFERQTKVYKRQRWLRRIVLTDDKISLEEVGEILTYNYDELEKVLEKKNRIRLFFNDGTVLRMYKDSFIEGNWGECKSWIDEWEKKSDEKE